MTTIRRFVLRLLSFFRPGAAEAELSREIHSHLQLLEDEFVSKGLPRDEARLAARRAFGGVEQAKEHQRDARGFRWLDNSRMDFKLGARMLAKYPALSLIGGAGQAVDVAIGAGFFAWSLGWRPCRHRAGARQLPATATDGGKAAHLIVPVIFPADAVIASIVKVPPVPCATSFAVPDPDAPCGLLMVLTS